jgi:hypothetical protein
LIVSVSAETRTLDPLIKSQLLYQLSYEDKMDCKYSGFHLLRIFFVQDVRCILQLSLLVCDDFAVICCPEKNFVEKI